MTITAEQLDELEAMGKSNPDRDFVLSGPLTLQLLAIARAALAWSEATDAEIDAKTPEARGAATLRRLDAADAMCAALEGQP